jgi:hypothetical protein
MKTDREVMQQALEALKAMNPYPASKEDQRACAIAALRARLAEPETCKPALQVERAHKIGANEMMTDGEAAAWTRGHAVGMKELKAAEKGWQKERAVRIAQRNLWADEAKEARADVQRLRRRELYWYGLALAVNAAWLIANWMEVV